eukprot:TRINITY_DN1034_c0_g1_i15.p1 TRINITY_DN1034_c0_g1~~TRINITY_DN1034_c0_g1_i15.p1  ORF type:complete len:299 (+),score=52.10 TRINITY_DN1034_c0_g1_i15:1464-2360(+)
MLYSIYVGFAFSGVSNFWNDLMKTIGSSRRVFELLDKISEENTGSGIFLTHIIGHIQFQDVTFTYPSRPNLPVLNCFSLEIPAGTSMAIVGHSGSGKSTLSWLLCKFYSHQEGNILIDNLPISEINNSCLRSNIAVVHQDVVMFSGSILDNIRYSKPEATMKEVLKATEKANAHQFITSFPNGYDTQVGERGVQLSGGQKQRIAIARAILKDPKILILDEATSSLDVESEYLVQQAINELMVGRTVLVIAHRLSTIRKANRIAVLKNGAVVEIGSYDELKEKHDGYFKNMIDVQRDGF